MELKDLAGIGPTRLKSLSAVGITSLRDLLYNFPVKYEDHGTVFPCSTQYEGMILIEGEVAQEPVIQHYHGLTRASTRIRDRSGTMPVQWFNCPWIRNTLKAGQKVRLYGRMTAQNKRRMLQNPRIITDTGLVPVYKKTDGIPQKSFQKLVAQALELSGEILTELLPEAYRAQHGLSGIREAMEKIHRPVSLEDLTVGQHRIQFEQMLLYLTHVSRIKGQVKRATAISGAQDMAEKYWKALPFAPTGAQRRVLQEITADMEKAAAMKRLVQGDVGCGKTAVAFGAIAVACQKDFQAAMMAPTEILATQHYENACHILAPMGIRCRLLTGSTRIKERKAILLELESGECQAVFGTQALLTETVQYHRLGLVVTDEQHRFGVNQRTALQQKGDDEEHRFPHVLVMSATPIPRSMALILYGDLDLSLIDEMPAGRIPVRTRIVTESRRADLYRYLQKEVAAGKQAYIVCPKVEDEEDEEDTKSDGDGSPVVRSATGVFSEMKEGLFAETEIALTWGGQKSEEKQAAIRSFMEGKARILTATTVVEVGVNNPNASIMIIENAERFGLSQLHQLRGRVGRGSLESWCFLVSDKEEKLRILRETSDGFQISQKDLEMRGPGEIIGTRQSGHLGEMAGGDIRLIDEAGQSVRELRASDRLEDTTLIRQLEKVAEEVFALKEIGIN